MQKSLRSARKVGDLESFIKEHEKDEPGDLDKLDEALRRPVQGTGSKARPASSPEPSDD